MILPTDVVPAERIFSDTHDLVEIWRPRLGISEVINVETIDDDGEGDRELEARCVPIERDATGMWVFSLQIVVTPTERQRLERTVVHELVHVLLEPLRETYLSAKAAWILTTERPGEVFAGTAKLGDLAGKLIVLPPGSDAKPIIPAGVLEIWETVIDRVADAYLRAYAWRPSDDAIARAEARMSAHGREFVPSA